VHPIWGTDPIYLSQSIPSYSSNWISGKFPIELDRVGILNDGDGHTDDVTGLKKDYPGTNPTKIYHM